VICPMDLQVHEIQFEICAASIAQPFKKKKTHFSVENWPRLYVVGLPYGFINVLLTIASAAWQRWFCVES
jgi:hypothetical protein